MDEVKNQICSIYNLNKAFLRCKSGRIWKPSVMDYYLHMNRYNYILHNRLMKDKYEVKPPYFFKIYEPKQRDIQAPHLMDRIIQSSVCATYLKKELRWIFVRGNTACQEGKGTDYARNLFKELLRRWYRRYGTEGVVWSIDIKKYFYSIDGDCLHEINLKYIHNDWARSFIERWGVPVGKKGLGLGAETNQYEACLALHPIDVFFTTVKGCKYYVRYQDDIKIILHSVAEARQLERDLIRELGKQKLTLNRKKTSVQRLTAWYPFLGFRFTMTGNGKVLMKIKDESVSRQRRKCRNQYRAIPSEDIAVSASTWIAHASKGDNFFLIRRMEDYCMEIERAKRELEKKAEAAAAQAAKANANADYIAMMCDVEIPENEEGANVQ